jgi:hypothetical protein
MRPGARYPEKDTREGRPWTPGRSRWSRKKPTFPRRAVSKSASAARAQEGAVPMRGEPEDNRPRSSQSTREGRHTTSTPTGSDREQRLKEGLEEVSGIRGARLPTPAPRREVSPGRSSSRRMCPSPTESSSNKNDSYSNTAQGRRAEGRSSSPKPRKSDEWRGWNKWDRLDRHREDIPEEGEPLGPRRTTSARSGPRGHHRERRGTWIRRGT